LEIKLLKTIAEEIGLKEFKKYGINPDSWGWKGQVMIDLTTLSKKEMQELRATLEPHQNIRGTGVIIRDIDTWIKAIEIGADEAKARSCRQFEPLLIRFIGEVPGHRVYERFEEEDIYLCYYVQKIEYHEEENRNGYRAPAFVKMKMAYESFGGERECNVDFYIEDIRGNNTMETLAKRGLYIETEELRSAYLNQMARFGKTVKLIGKQYLASRTATDENMDGNPSGRDTSWYWHQTNTYKMEKDGAPSRVLIDVFKEGEKDDREREVHVNKYFWIIESNLRLIKQHKKKSGGKENDEDDRDLRKDSEEILEDLDVEIPELEVPIHPFVAIFDLKRHLRLKIHINFLEEYIYDSKISEKLILPKYLKDLVAMLIEHSGSNFKDIVEGKSGGAVVLLSGPPGTGKTLTAEVYAEAEHKGLYSVQCSQLGTDPENLEDELLKVFSRAQRWGAVLLLDEADVYVRQRGSDLQQNAIVGVFLRVLEYQGSVLFLTTNRPEDVDDAIASRCVARLNYKVPGEDHQKQIWRVLADASKIELSDEIIQQIAIDNPTLSGRDVKNLLKLACLISNNRKIPISQKVIRFVRQFKPTQSEDILGEVEELETNVTPGEIYCWVCSKIQEKPIYHEAPACKEKFVSPMLKRRKDIEL
jgi:SpoVK/Ycf46/Vps4 family AAA+-type ATPase